MDAQDNEDGAVSTDQAADGECSGEASEAPASSLSNFGRSVTLPLGTEVFLEVDEKAETADETISVIVLRIGKGKYKFIVNEGRGFFVSADGSQMEIK